MEVNLVAPVLLGPYREARVSTRTGKTGSAFSWSPAKLRIGNQVKFVERPIRPRGMNWLRKSTSRVFVFYRSARARLPAERFQVRAWGGWREGELDP